MENLGRKIWTEVQNHLQRIVNPELYSLWFAPLRPLNMENDRLLLAVANEFSEVWLRDNYLDLLEDVLGHVTGQPYKVDFQVNGYTPDMVLEEGDQVRENKPPNSQAVAARNSELLLNPKYTFDTFVVGSNNNFAHAAATAVAQSPGRSYNPLFVYGGVGLGKTHLLHAIGQHVVGNKKNARVAYVSSEKFTNEYIDAIQNNKVMRFRRKYRQTDLLLIDDVQFLSGKERIQEEFFHTYNALHESHKQIVLTCDRPATEIRNLENRLVSRFEWGLVTDLQLPDVETRLAILKKKSASMGMKIDDAILQFLAKRIRLNIRRLEGALIRVASFSSLTGKPLTLELVEDLLKEILHEENQGSVNVSLIQKRVAEHFDIRLADMTSRRRPEHIAFPRQIAMFLSRHLTDNSLSTIGDSFGGRDHGTVLHACRLVKDRMEVDDTIKQTVGFLEKQLLR